MCPTCKGKCLISEKKTFEVHIEQGMKQGSKVVLRGEAGCSEPGLAPGRGGGQGLLLPTLHGVTNRAPHLHQTVATRVGCSYLCMGGGWQAAL